MKAKPIIKWAGGKNLVLPLIAQKIEHVPDFHGTFFDVFGGGASVTLMAQTYFKKLHFNDTNKELINLYQVIRDYPEELMTLLDEHAKKHGRDYYYSIRKLDRDENYENLAPLQRAARFVYLNKTCYNGLYRVNAKGHFNVPIGRQSSLNLYDKQNILSFSKAFESVEISNSDYSPIIKIATKGDLVYIDPPYDKIHQQSFVGYNGKVFDEFDQARLADDVHELTGKGVYVIFSNAATQRVEQLYERYLNNDSYIDVRRMIASKPNGREITQEILADNFRVVSDDR